MNQAEIFVKTPRGEPGRLSLSFIECLIELDVFYFIFYHLVIYCFVHLITKRLTDFYLMSYASMIIIEVLFL